MGHFTSIRGWLQMSESLLPEVHERIIGSKGRCTEYGLTPEDAYHYLNGFTFQERTINWSGYVFYGADIRSSAVQFIEDLVREVAEQVFRRDQDFLIRPLGVFHVSDEDDVGVITMWLVVEGRLEKKTVDFPYKR